MKYFDTMWFQNLLIIISVILAGLGFYFQYDVQSTQTAIAKIEKFYEGELQKSRHRIIDMTLRANLAVVENKTSKFLDDFISDYQKENTKLYGTNFLDKDIINIVDSLEGILSCIDQNACKKSLAHEFIMQFDGFYCLFGRRIKNLQFALGNDRFGALLLSFFRGRIICEK